MDGPIDYSRFDEGRGMNYWAQDPALQREVRRVYRDDELDHLEDSLSEYGRIMGETIADNADTVDEHDPILHTYDEEGEVINEVEQHPAHEEDERLTFEHGVVADAFRAPEGRDDPMPHGHSLANYYLMCYADVGLACIVSMTGGAALVLEKYGDGLDHHLDALTSASYEQRATGAMFLTEIQGGSDVGANETVAEPTEDASGEPGDVYELTGEKWFCSNVDGEAPLVLARRPDAPEGTEGLSLFVVPPETDDDPVNGLFYRRLKDKLGTKSVPTGEVELDGARGELVGEPENGFKQMAEMLNYERLTNAIGSAGGIGRALLESKIYAANRDAFGGPVIDKPLMQRDLVEMTVAHEAGTAFTFDALAAFDAYHAGDTDRPAPAESAAPQDPDEAFRLMRILTPVAKYRLGEMALEHVTYAMEVFGGNGYVEDYPTNRMVRDTHVTPIWEGTSNVLSLDVLRALQGEASHVPLLARIDELLDRLDHPELTERAELVRDERDALEDEVNALATEGRDHAQLHAKAFADHVFDVHTAALLLSEAQTGIDDEEDARMALIAEAFVDEHLREGRDVADGSTWAVDHFDAIVRHAPADTAVLGADAPAAD